MPSITLAIMVRDDEVRLARAIQSAKDAVDEVVVLDTGSKDGSIEVARSLGARVDEIEWPGSFSVGLNALLDLVETDWVLRLDSDEWFEAHPRGDLERAMADHEAYGFMLIRRDILPLNAIRDISIFRLWRHHPALRYEGLVHENIGNSGIAAAFPELKVKELPLWFWHDGYKEGSEDKLRRNVALLEEEVALRPGNAYYEAMLAAMYRDLGDARWIPAMERIVDDRLASGGKAKSRMDALVFTAAIDQTPDDKLATRRTQEMAQFLATQFPAYPGSLWTVGSLELRRGRLKESLETFLALERLSSSGRYDRSVPCDPAILGDGLWNALGFVGQQLSRWDVCERAAARLQAKN